MDAAERLFAAYGFAEVSSHRIAREAGIAQSQINYHFESKRGLWEAVFDRRFVQYYRAQSDELDRHYDDELERLRASIRAYFSFFREHPEFAALHARLQLDDTQIEDVPISSELMTRGVEAIARAQAEGVLRDDLRPEFILIGFLSLVAHWFQGRSRYLSECGIKGNPQNHDDAYLDFILDAFVAGVRR